MEKDAEQLFIYAMALKQVFELDPVKLSYYYIEDNKTISEEITEKKLEKVSAWALNIIEKIVGGEMTPTPGHPCQYCDYKEICEYRA